MEHHHHDMSHMSDEGSYQPLIVVVIIALLMALTQESTMYAFMGFFFVLLSLFKFFDLSGFVEGFSTYDLITPRVRAYGYAYPFIELALGLAYIGQYQLELINWVTVVVMAISGLGVLRNLSQGNKIKCVCLGTALNVPLTAVSLLENFGMGVMAAIKGINIL